MSDAPQGFDAMKSRLDEIVDEVSAEGISLDEALALYEEAVKLGLSACDVSEADILASEQEGPAGEAGPEPASAADAAQADGAAPVPEGGPDAGDAVLQGQPGDAEAEDAPRHAGSDEAAPF